MNRISFNLLGPQGSGKGTQSDALLERYNFTRFDLGENLRDIEDSGSELGLEIAKYVDEGHLVPVELIAEVTREKLMESNHSQDVLFDGLLRTIKEIEAQHHIFNELHLEMPVIIFLDLDEETAVKRLSTRRICKACHGRFTVSDPNATNIPCPRCGATLVARNDDRPDAIKHRLELYHESTEPVIDYFRENGKVIQIDASPDVATVTKNIVREIDAHYQSIGRQAPKK